MTASNDIMFKTEQPWLVKIWIGDRVGLTLRVVDDVIVAEYEPGDLDAAAEAFVDKVNRLLNSTKSDPTTRHKAAISRSERPIVDREDTRSAFPEVVTEGDITITIYEADGTFVVADQAGWIPGSFPTRNAALAAARAENGLT